MPHRRQRLGENVSDIIRRRDLGNLNLPMIELGGEEEIRGDMFGAFALDEPLTHLMDTRSVVLEEDSGFIHGLQPFALPYGGLHILHHASQEDRLLRSVTKRKDLSVVRRRGHERLFR